MLRSYLTLVLVPLALALAACGDSGTGDSTGSPGEKPEAPHLDEVKPMASVLHVAWTATTACDMIMAERKDDQHPDFAAAFQVDGSKTSHMDGEATMNMTYTYRLQCMVGDGVSDYSNELGGNPTVTSP